MLRILGQSTSCSCAKYHPLELSRDQIDKRIKETENILRYLNLQGESTALAAEQRMELGR